MIEPSGLYWGYYGAATGKGRQAAKAELEKLDLSAWRRSREAIRERTANRAFDLLRRRLADGANASTDR